MSPLPPAGGGGGGCEADDMKQFKPRKTGRARELRNNATPAEKKLWPYLSARKLAGIRFNRQVCIGPFICDFAARSHKLIVEIDGDSHGHRISYDDRRTRYLERQGYRVVRFWNNDVLNNLEGVLRQLEEVAEYTLSPSPSREREGD